MPTSENRMALMHGALSSAIRQRRIAAGISQSRLADLTGSGRARITKLENGDPECSFELAIRTLLALGATRRDVGEILGAGRGPPRKGRTP